MRISCTPFFTIGMILIRDEVFSPPSSPPPQHTKSPVSRETYLLLMMVIAVLKHIVAAMKPGYSRLLLCENVIPNVGASTYQAMADVSMMYTFSASERTASKWTWLLAGAGLEIVKIWSDPSSSESIMEARVASS